MNYLIQNSWESYPYLPYLDIWTPFLMGLTTPRPLIGFVGEHSRDTNPLYLCNTPVVFKTLASKNNMWIIKSMKDLFTLGFVPTYFSKSLDNVWCKPFATDFIPPAYHLLDLNLVNTIKRSFEIQIKPKKYQCIGSIIFIRWTIGCIILEVVKLHTLSPFQGRWLVNYIAY